MSTSGDDRDYFDESDVERSDDLRRDAVRRKSMARHNVREGELTLPSRLPPSQIVKAPDPIVPTRSSSLSHRKAKQRIPMTVNTHTSVSSGSYLYHARILNMHEISHPVHVPSLSSPSSVPLVAVRQR